MRKPSIKRRPKSPAQSGGVSVRPFSAVEFVLLPDALGCGDVVYILLLLLLLLANNKKGEGGRGKRVSSVSMGTVRFPLIFKLSVYYMSSYKRK